MTCAEAMKTGCYTCVPHQRLSDALEIMADQQVEWVAVIESHANPCFLGWITAQHAAVYLGVFDRRPSEAMCRDLISTPPAVLSPEQDVDAARALIARCCLRQLPVINDGRLAGILGLE